MFIPITSYLLTKDSLGKMDNIIKSWSAKKTLNITSKRPHGIYNKTSNSAPPSGNLEKLQANCIAV